MKEQHSESENRTELYEDVLLGKKLWTRLYRKLFWNGVSKKQIVKAMLKYIPEDFKGRLLDVPAGTGLFTYRKYSWMRDARIICYDEKAFCKRRIGSCYRKEGELCEAAVS